MLPLSPYANSFFKRIGCWIVSNAFEKSKVTPTIIFPELSTLFIFSTSEKIAWEVEYPLRKPN